ncbi:MAG TPA: hypothetical protein VHH14_01640, partial [Solirubrobacterales bacterium]|nr:hypothetical protein [Solirubrobacterales bacterium]
DDPESVAPAAAEGTLAASAARLARDLMEAMGASSERVAKALEQVADAVKRVRDALGALLGAGGAPEPVEELLERVGAVITNVAEALGTLLGARGPPGPDGNLLEQVGAVVADLARGMGDALGSLLPGGSEAPGPAGYRAGYHAVLPLAFYGLPEPSARLLEQGVGAAKAELARMAGGAHRASGPAHPADSPVAPPAAPLPETPSLPLPIAPGGAAAASASLLGASGSPSGDPQLPFAVLVLFSVALLQGGKLVCRQREPLRPASALRPAAERPG